jgi:mono/diheme cytochrome c family protein
MKSLTGVFVMGCALSLASCSPSSEDHSGTAEAPKNAGTVAKIYGDAQRGGALVEKWCLACHVLDASVASDQVPSFKSVAENPMKTSDYLRGFLARPHEPMPPLQLSNQDIEDVIVFIRGLDGTKK